MHVNGYVLFELEDTTVAVYLCSQDWYFSKRWSFYDTSFITLYLSQLKNGKSFSVTRIEVKWYDLIP